MTDTGVIEYLMECDECRLPIRYRAKYREVIEAGETITRTLEPSLSLAMLIHDRQHTSYGP